MNKIDKKTFEKFLDFRLMVSFSIIKYLYIIVAVIINIAAFISLFAGVIFPSILEGKDFTFGMFLLNLLGVILGTVILNIVWRLICEKLVILFSIHKMLSDH
jgi:hypothetical protein